MPCLRERRELYLTLQEFCCDLFYCQAAFTNAKQLDRERAELAHFRRPRGCPADCQLHRLVGYVMQRASLPESPNNLPIISRDLDDIDSWRHAETAGWGKLGMVREDQVIGPSLLTLADRVRFMQFMIAAKQCLFVVHQRGNNKGRLAASGNVVEPHKLRATCA
jgi:hypothetical protein